MRMENVTCSHEDQKELASKNTEKKNAVSQGRGGFEGIWNWII